MKLFIILKGIHFHLCCTVSSRICSIAPKRKYIQSSLKTTNLINIRVIFCLQQISLLIFRDIKLRIKWQTSFALTIIVESHLYITSQSCSRYVNVFRQTYQYDKTPHLNALVMNEGMRQNSSICIYMGTITGSLPAYLFDR